MLRDLDDVIDVGHVQFLVLGFPFRDVHRSQEENRIRFLNMLGQLFLEFQRKFVFLGFVPRSTLIGVIPFDQPSRVILDLDFPRILILFFTLVRIAQSEPQFVLDHHGRRTGLLAIHHQRPVLVQIRLGFRVCDCQRAALEGNRTDKTGKKSGFSSASRTEHRDTDCGNVTHFKYLV